MVSSSRPQVAASRLRQMGASAIGRPEHVIVEHRAPGAFLLLRAVAQAQQRMQQRVLRRIHVRWRRGPPVVDHDIERLECVDLVPPHRGIEECVARFQFGDLRGSQCLAQSREALEVRRADVCHGHDLTARRRLEGTWIEILDLLGRKQREAASTDQATGDVVRHVVMGERRGAVADPRGDQRRVRFEHGMVQDEVVLGRGSRAGTCPRPSSPHRRTAHCRRRDARGCGRGTRRADRDRIRNRGGWRRLYSRNGPSVPAVATNATMRRP